jgi:putative membrane protein
LSQWESIVNFLIYLGVTVPLMGLGILFFNLTTPYNEFRLIRDGADLGDPSKVAASKAAAHDLGGKIIGQALVLASAVYHSVSIVDLIIWGLLGIAFQIIVFYLFELLTPFKVVAEIPKGNVSVGVFSFCLSAASGLLMASLISY